MNDTETTFRSIGEIAEGVVAKLSIGKVERHQVTDRDSWLKMRGADVTASDVASICGVGYRSPLAVWAEKKGLVPPQADNEILKRGRILEPAIWAAIREEQPDWELRAAKVYLRAPTLRLGATPDALAIDPARDGIVLIQGKVVAKPVFESEWLDGGDTPRVPLKYQLQTLTETMLAEKAYQQTVHPVLAALVVDTFSARLHLLPVRRHGDAEQKVLATVKKFWADFDAGLQPPVMPDQDHDTVKALYPEDDGETVDLTGDNTLPALLDERKKLGEIETSAKKRREEIGTEILGKVGTASFALIAGGRKISCKTTHVGEAVRAAYSFRSVREVKVKAAK